MLCLPRCERGVDGSTTRPNTFLLHPSSSNQRVGRYFHYQPVQYIARRDIYLPNIFHYHTVRFCQSRLSLRTVCYPFTLSLPPLFSHHSHSSYFLSGFITYFFFNNVFSPLHFSSSPLLPSLPRPCKIPLL